MPTTPGTNPFGSSHFLVEIDGIPAAGFVEVSGLEADVAVVDYRNGNDKSGAAHKLPGEAKYANLTLKRGLTADLNLWTWMQQTLDGQVSRRNLSVILMNEKGDPVMRFNVKDAWPVRWTGPTLNAEANTVALETLEIAHEGLSVAV